MLCFPAIATVLIKNTTHKMDVSKVKTHLCEVFAFLN